MKKHHDDDNLVRTPDGVYVHAQHSSSDRRIMDAPGPSLRVYQVWKGNNVGLFLLQFSLFRFKDKCTVYVVID